MADKEFKFATSDKGDLSIDSIELSYTNAVTDEDGNNVALLDNLNSNVTAFVVLNFIGIALNYVASCFSKQNNNGES